VTPLVTDAAVLTGRCTGRSVPPGRWELRIRIRNALVRPRILPWVIPGQCGVWRRESGVSATKPNPQLGRDFDEKVSNCWDQVNYIATVISSRVRAFPGTHQAGFLNTFEHPEFSNLFRQVRQSPPKALSNTHLLF
jgi:hypothetical protein